MPSSPSSPSPLPSPFARARPGPCPRTQLHPRSRPFPHTHLSQVIPTLLHTRTIRSVVTKTQVMPGIEKFIIEKHERIPTSESSAWTRQTFVAQLLQYWLDHHPYEASRIIVVFEDQGGRRVELIGDEVCRLYRHIASNTLSAESCDAPHAADSDTPPQCATSKTWNCSRPHGAQAHTRAAKRLVYRKEHKD